MMRLPQVGVLRLDFHMTLLWRMPPPSSCRSSAFRAPESYKKKELIHVLSPGPHLQQRAGGLSRLRNGFVPHHKPVAQSEVETSLARVSWVRVYLLRVLRLCHPHVSRAPHQLWDAMRHRRRRQLLERSMRSSRSSSGRTTLFRLSLHRNLAWSRSHAVAETNARLPFPPRTLSRYAPATSLGQQASCESHTSSLPP